MEPACWGFSPAGGVVWNLTARWLRDRSAVCRWNGTADRSNASHNGHLDAFGLDSPVGIRPGARPDPRQPLWCSAAAHSALKRSKDLSDGPGGGDAARSAQGAGGGASQIFSAILDPQHDGGAGRDDAGSLGEAAAAAGTGWASAAHVTDTSSAVAAGAPAAAAAAAAPPARGAVAGRSPLEMQSLLSRLDYG